MESGVLTLVAAEPAIVSQHATADDALAAARALLETSPGVRIGLQAAGAGGAGRAAALRRAQRLC
ncbi:hypothetical protein Q5424_25405, partial [Conexibacter sp. JD483]